MAKAKAAGKASKDAPKKSISKAALIQAVTESLGDGVSKKQVQTFIETLVEVAHKELNKTGIFTLPGFAKFVVVKKGPVPAREGINPFTKQKQMFPAKPATKTVRARPIKAIKDAVA